MWPNGKGVSHRYVNDSTAVAEIIKPKYNIKDVVEFNYTHLGSFATHIGRISKITITENAVVYEITNGKTVYVGIYDKNIISKFDEALAT